MSTPFFSIVIPVYNGLTHDLPKCLDSIVGQSLDKNLYEIICVDDCSTDGTRAWLKEQQKSLTNLRIIENEKNIRQGGSRNKGVRAANGKYIIFIDQDDYYHKEAITQVYEHLKESDLQILVVDCAYQSPGKESNTLQHNFPHREVMTGDEIIEKNSIPYAPWKFIFLQKFMTSNELYFAENERIEDVDWVHKLVHYAERVQYRPILFIHYNKSNISTTMTSYKSCETVYSTLRLAQRMNEMLTSTFAQSSEGVKAEIARISRMMAFIGIRSYLFFSDSTTTKAQHIQRSIGDLTGGNSIVRFAQRHPRLYSALSNAVSPLSRVAMIVYRWVKYL